MKKLLLFLTACGALLAQNALAPVGKQQFFDGSGKPLAGGLLYTYSAGTATPAATFSDSSGSANTNPVVLDAAGRAAVWLDTSKSYKFSLFSRTGVLQYTADNIQAGAGGGGASSSVTVAGTAHQVLVTGAPAYVLSLPQSIDTTSDVVHKTVTATGVVKSQAAGAAIAFQTDAPYNFQVDGNGNVSGAGSFNATGTASAYKMGGTTVIDVNKNGTFNDITITGTCTGCGAGGTLPVSDATVIAYKAADATARFRFSVTGITGGTTRVLTVPDFDTDIAGLAGVQTFTGAKTFSAVVTGSAGYAGTVYNSTATGATHGFQLANSNFIVDGAGNITNSGNTITTGYITAGTWLGLPVTAGTPGTIPGTGFGAFTYKGGSNFWYYNSSTASWATADMAAVGGGVTGVNGFSGSVSIVGTTSQVVVANGTNTVTLSLPQSIATTSTPTFSTLTLSSAATNALSIPNGFITAGGIIATSTNYDSIQTANGFKGLQLTLAQKAVPGLSAANTGVVYFDSTTKKFMASENGGAYVNLLGGAAGVASLNSLTGAVSIGSGTGVTISYPGSNTLLMSIGQNVATNSAVTFGSVTTASGGVVQSGATGTSASFQNTNFNFIVNGNGDVSAAGSVNISGSYKSAGTTVIDSSRNVFANNITAAGTLVVSSTASGALTVAGSIIPYGGVASQTGGIGGTGHNTWYGGTWYNGTTTGAMTCSSGQAIKSLYVYGGIVQYAACGAI